MGWDSWDTGRDEFRDVVARVTGEHEFKQVIRKLRRKGMKGEKEYKLYSADLRRHLEIRAPYWEAAGTLEHLHNTEAWKHRPSVITDADGRIVETNQIDVAHNG